MTHHTGLSLLPLVLLLACAPARPAQPAPSQTDPAARAGPTRVTIAIGAEVTSLASKLEPQRTYGGEFGFISNSPLVIKDEKGTPSPLLAADLPSRDRGDWVVNPDGTMRTTWRIKPNARWHDGQPVVSRDFVFALKVYSDSAMPVREREPERFMDRIEAVDDKTFTIHWKQSYPWANEITNRQLEALPDHIMGAVYDAGDKDAFVNHAFWTSTSYVGNGPYRIVQWEPGSQLVYRAFDDYFMGRPPIDEVVVRIIPDANTLVASVLSGAIDATVGITLGQQAGATIRGQWSQSREGEVIATPTRFRYTQVQLDPARNGQPALFDVRVRRAIVHGLDRQTMAQVVSDGASPATDVPISPSDPLFPAVQRSIARYPYDPARAAALLQEAGWTRRGESLAGFSGQPLTLDIRTTQGTDSETEASIMASDLSKLGLQMSQTVVPQSRISDVEYRVTFPGLNNTAAPIDVPATMNVAHSDQCATAERRFVGTNRGCWKNADYDRLFITASTSLERAERENAIIEGLRILADDVGIIGLNYSVENVAVRKGLVGPGVRWPAQVGNTWNIHLWRWE